jgi:hypothetical protein
LGLCHPWKSTIDKKKKPVYCCHVPPLAIKAVWGRKTPTLLPWLIGEKKEKCWKAVVTMVE